MSYTAETYPYIVDQLLTALTGGVSREHFRFFPGDNNFKLKEEADRVVLESLCVAGQVNESFFVFREGKDYFIDPDGILRFKLDGKDAQWPDEGSEFFVSYYRTDSSEAPLTDRNVGSLTRTLAEAFARELAVLRRQLELVYRSGFVDTAEGSDLDGVVALLGISRKSREFASGVARFSRETPAPADIFIPQGTRISTALNPPVSFVTTEDKTLRRGQLSVEVNIRAEIKGAKGVVAEKTISVVNQPILGISEVTNDAPTVFGGAAESDVELRARAKKVAEKAGKATPRAIMSALTGMGNLKENEIKIVEELQLRPGVVQVFVAKEPSKELAMSVQDSILKSRAAGIRVEHNLAVALPASPKELIPAGEARDEGVGTDVPAGDDFRLPLRCDVVVFPENPRLAGAEQDKMRSAVSNAISSYIDSLAIGGLMVYNRIVADVMAIPGIMDVVLDINTRGEESTRGKRNIDIPDGRKATIIDPAKDITARFAGAPVYFDFYFRVMRKGGSNLPNIEKEIKAKLVDFFSGFTGGVEVIVDTAKLMGTLAVSEIYELKEADLTWSVEYEQSGLIIHDQGGAGAATTVAAGDRALLRDVRVEEKKNG